MELVVRYRITLAIVLVAAAATGGFLAFGLPRVTVPNQRTVDLAHVHHYSAALVRRTFAAHGVELRYSIKDLSVVWLTDVRQPAPVPDGALYVLVPTERDRSVSWGPKPANEYDQPVGNLLVHYGGRDPAILARVKAAVAALPR